MKRSSILLSQIFMSANDFPISTLRREGTHLKPLDNKLFCDVINILDDLLKISHCSEKSELLYTSLCTLSLLCLLLKYLKKNYGRWKFQLDKTL
jgi:hypothetical protein